MVTFHDFISNMLLKSAFVWMTKVLASSEGDEDMQKCYSNVLGYLNGLEEVICGESVAVTFAFSAVVKQRIRAAAQVLDCAHKVCICDEATVRLGRGSQGRVRHVATILLVRAHPIARRP